ncbi:hypothetical protein A2609_02620 [Candidatus Kaiserbacteria bacterium RIFOXYD1_FULL_47_14]|uniref:Uncharacterized protein n=1 Tax=Candidatus Kaiserbacteria bacterium RIFOXYD1_FULL_47_14 TaxID=1798533 RepID=A0A1F6G4W1_9BACT|nr:MAG: hypothetical protein A2609_02620 [Candidatus Kaiserbacteria bacterium RIFOXYD1_FULL_47_14]
MNMNNHPFLNALSATAYISFVASMMFYAPEMNIPEPSLIIPIMMLSLLVLSASLMGYFFFCQPVRLLIEGKQKEATKFFLSTIGIFALITLALVLIWFSTTLYFSA